jgi:small-conductance mechanosensitive channel
MSLTELWNQEPWVRLGGAVCVALLFAVAIRRAGWVVMRRLARGRPLAADMLRRASAPMEWLVPLLMLSLALRLAPEANRLLALDLLQHLLLVALIATAAWLLVRCVSALEGLAIHQYPIDKSDNLRARRVLTQVRVLGRTFNVLIVLLALSMILLTFPNVRQLGTSLLASAGVAGLALGFAAKPVLGNLIAGLQIALTQPIRLDDVVIIENEWGRIEEITGTYVVVKIWDERRLVVPLNWFMENPFQNWTRTSSKLIGTVFLWVDYGLPLEPLREELKRICAGAPEWDGWVCLLQVTDANEKAMQLRALVSSADSPLSWDLRCRVREGLIAFVQANYPQSLPRLRAELGQPPLSRSLADPAVDPAPN